MMMLVHREAGLKKMMKMSLINLIINKTEMMKKMNKRNISNKKLFSFLSTITQSELF